MIEEPADRVQALFDQAVELPPEERSAFLDVACRGEPALRAEVESLLAYDAPTQAEPKESGFLESPLVRAHPGAITVPASGTPSAGSVLPSRIGPYRVVRWLGEGGMGVVYEAVQDNPRRTVALKVIRTGFFDAGLVARFTQEAQILGLLHHPGIAQVYDAGVADGQPYFAMEFIRGVPLDEYARLRSLTPAARLELIARVCDAVQHAHDQCVIHRDLKPGNILVEETGQPRVLDFGVARADADVRASDNRTRTGQLIGTLSYMSPEQVRADPTALDARSDVYALGVNLFELLAGQLPYPLEHLPVHEAAQMILTREPTRLGSLQAQFRGDVETIVAKALEKDKARRYQAAAALAADIRRYLSHEPIRARPPSALYQFRKFARRNRALVVGTLGVVAALVVGLIGTILFALREAEQRRLAEDREQKALYQAYRARVAAAGAALQNHDVADAERQLREAPESLHGRTGRVNGVTFAPGSRRLASVSWHEVPHDSADSTVRLWDVEPRTTLSALRGHTRAVYPVAVSPDGRWLASGSWDNTVRVWDAVTGEPCATLPHPFVVHGLAYGPDGSWLVSGCDRDDRLRIWDAVTARVRKELPVSGGSPRWVTVNPDGTRVAATVYDPPGKKHQLHVYDVASGERLFSAEGWALAYSPDGRWLAVRAADEQTVFLLDARTHETAARFQGHEKSVYKAAFSPDSRRLASCSRDRTVRLWQLDSGACRELTGHTDEVYAVAFHPDGTRLATGGRDGRSGCGTWRGAKRWRGCRDTRASFGRWPSAPTARRSCPAPATPPCGCGTPSPCACAIRRGERPQPCAPRRTGWSWGCSGRRRTPAPWARPCGRTER